MYTTIILSFFFGAFQNQFLLKNNTPLHEKEKGTAIFHPTNIKLQTSFFNTSYVYSGVLSYYQNEDGKEFFHLPCQIHAPKSEELPCGDCDYFLNGYLEKTKSMTFIFIPTSPWTKIDDTFSLADLRFKLKSKFKKFIKMNIDEDKIRDFYFGLCTGEIDNKMLSYDFSKLGLQHILAISGFHFSLVAAFCAFIVNRIFTKNLSALLLLLILSLYFVFLGNSPSVFRAWCAIAIHILGNFLHRKSNGLNTLGVCLLLELLFFPSNIYNLGFQFSFACTFGILFLLPATTRFMSYIFPKRKSEQIKKLPALDKGVYLITSFLRNGLALTLAVQITALPICLYHFSTFPVLSLLYNLFFPLLTGICLFVFLIACCAYFILPQASKLLFSLLSQFSSFLLDTTSFTPKILQLYINWHIPDVRILAVYLGIVFLLFSFKKEKPLFSKLNT
jgi:competence protein ComEC